MQQNVIIHGDHLIKDSRIIIFEKLASKKLCKVPISSSSNKITPVTYFEIMLNANNSLHICVLFSINVTQHFVLK